MENIHLYEEPEFDAETQERLDSQVDRLLKGYDWTLAPLANKSVLSQCPLLLIICLSDKTLSETIKLK